METCVSVQFVIAVAKLDIVVCKHNELAHSAANEFKDSFQCYKCWKHNTACPSESRAEWLGYVLQGVVTPTGAILRGVSQVTCSHLVTGFFLYSHKVTNVSKWLQTNFEMEEHALYFAGELATELSSSNGKM